MFVPTDLTVEGDGKETKGQQPVIRESEDWVSDKTFHGETVAGPIVNGAKPKPFAVYFTLDVLTFPAGELASIPP